MKELDVPSCFRTNRAVMIERRIGGRVGVRRTLDSGDE